MQSHIIYCFILKLVKLREITNTMDVKEDIHEIDSLFRKIVIESRTLDYELEEFVMNKNALKETAVYSDDKENLT